ncbi:MAG: YbjN domain-containing protein [Gemmatimonadota bacterium]
MQPFLDHLAQRGYELEERAENVWFAGHGDFPAMFVLVGMGGFILRAYFADVKSAPRETPLQQANRLNREAVASRFYLDDDQDLVVEAWHPGEYEEKAFDAFLDAWLRDLRTLLEVHQTAQRSFDA